MTHRVYLNLNKYTNLNRSLGRYTMVQFGIVVLITILTIMQTLLTDLRSLSVCVEKFLYYLRGFVLEIKIKNNKKKKYLK